MTATEFNYMLINKQDDLKKFAMSLTSNVVEAEDLVQETCLKALSKKDYFLRQPKNLVGWLFTIMKNIFINQYRRAVNHKKVNYDKNSSMSANFTKTTQLNPESDYTMKEIQEKLNNLDEKHKTPLKMFLSGYKYQEIAEKLNLNMGTVKSRIFFSRQLLKNQWA
ncbi:MAG: sigma-70 family RNA polymerase sigma factor [Bacteroidetes bacterium]|jgi:RNA polymerase sigma-70 factor (ECF subfamily)|nr:sigma-70 family RNA polymerase sigma factor [Bacteroidota bacterium]